MLAISTSASTANIVAFPPRGIFRQHDLFSASGVLASTAIVGAIIKRSHAPCRSCAAVHFIIGSSAAMHCAKLTCAECGAFAGWMSRGEFTYAKMTVDKSGMPITAITVRENKKDS